MFSASLSESVNLSAGVPGPHSAEEWLQHLTHAGQVSAAEPAFSPDFWVLPLDLVLYVHEGNVFYRYFLFWFHVFIIA